MAWHERRDNNRNAWRPVRSLGRPIEIGQRFFPVPYRKVVWEIVALSRYADEPIPHARMVRVDAPCDTKTVSVDVLSDPRFFRPVEES